ncbi:LON peptidase substrate-binding domain-containing protein [Glaciihabitans sp. UYNi722]|uniref:LON peptidase substrate-binding domain-containing protein n=1 Tax=Glaciihabitans sp. UYNi722 TaxID=3156344 RepID=UPI0033989ED0
MTDLPMFPLGSVLFPHMPVQLRVFEERYLVMLSRILQQEPSEFGIVLIERGQEVGGGEHRFELGTVAQITELEGAEGFVGLVAEGGRRIEVVEWLDEDPHPQATVREVAPLEWDDALLPLRERAEQTVRRALAIASEFSDQQWAADTELSDDAVASAWQLAAIAPLSELDQIALLRSTSMAALLGGTIDRTLAAAESLTNDW